MALKSNPALAMLIYSDVPGIAHSFAQSGKPIQTLLIG
jgi:hypothetical protein